MNISDMNKDELAEYADKHGIKLDMRKSIEALRKEIQLNEKPKAEEAKPVTPESTHLLNKATGFWFPWTPRLAKKDGFVPCNENGE